MIQCLILIIKLTGLACLASLISKARFIIQVYLDGKKKVNYLSFKRIAITGCTDGIGLEMSRELAR